MSHWLYLCLRWTVTLLVAVGTLALTVFLYIIIPKGFFPVQDTGVIQGISQAPQSISYTAMAAKQKQPADVILKDPAVESLSSFIGADGTNTTLTSRRMAEALKEAINGAKPSLLEVEVEATDSGVFEK